MPNMKVLLVHGAYQQFGGEDSVVRAETELLQSHGDEVCHYGRHNDEIKSFNPVQKALFFPQTVYSWKTSSEISDVVRALQTGCGVRPQYLPADFPLRVLHSCTPLAFPPCRFSTISVLFASMVFTTRRIECAKRVPAGTT